MDEERIAKREALRLLSLKSRFTAEVKKKLQLKGLSEVAIETVLKECTQLGYLNDEEKTERFVEGYLKRGYGPLFISKKLQEQGVFLSPHKIADEGMQIESIASLLEQRKFAGKKREAFMRAMLRRGFELEAVLKFWNNL